MSQHSLSQGAVENVKVLTPRVPQPVLRSVSANKDSSDELSRSDGLERLRRPSNADNAVSLPKKKTELEELMGEQQRNHQNLKQQQGVLEEALRQQQRRLDEVLAIVEVQQKNDMQAPSSAESEDFLRVTKELQVEIEQLRTQQQQTREMMSKQTLESGQPTEATTRQLEGQLRELVLELRKLQQEQQRQQMQALEDKTRRLQEEAEACKTLRDLKDERNQVSEMLDRVREEKLEVIKMMHTFHMEKDEAIQELEALRQAIMQEAMALGVGTGGAVDVPAPSAPPPSVGVPTAMPGGHVATVQTVLPPQIAIPPVVRQESSRRLEGASSIACIHDSSPTAAIAVAQQQPLPQQAQPQLGPPSTLAVPASTASGQGLAAVAAAAAATTCAACTLASTRGPHEIHRLASAPPPRQSNTLSSAAPADAGSAFEDVVVRTAQGQTPYGRQASHTVVGCGGMGSAVSPVHAPRNPSVAPSVSASAPSVPRILQGAQQPVGAPPPQSGPVVLGSSAVVGVGGGAGGSGYTAPVTLPVGSMVKTQLGQVLQPPSSTTTLSSQQHHQQQVQQQQQTQAAQLQGLGVSPVVRARSTGEGLFQPPARDAAAPSVRRFMSAGGCSPRASFVDR